MVPSGPDADGAVARRDASSSIGAVDATFTGPSTAAITGGMMSGPDMAVATGIARELKRVLPATSPQAIAPQMGSP